MIPEINRSYHPSCFATAHTIRDDYGNAFLTTTEKKTKNIGLCLEACFAFAASQERRDGTSGFLSDSGVTQKKLSFNEGWNVAMARLLSWASFFIVLLFVLLTSLDELEIRDIIFLLTSGLIIV